MITHGHADHARAGHRAVLATPETLAIMRARFGDRPGAGQQPLAYGESAAGRRRRRLASRPAGHVLGCAQVVLEYKAAARRRLRRLQAPARPDLRGLRAGALRRLRHRGDLRPAGVPPSADAGEIAKLLRSRRHFPERTHVVGGYALGKCQRLIALLRAAGWDRPIYLHGALLRCASSTRTQGVDLGELRPRRASDRRACRARSCCARRRPSPTAGRGGFADPVPALRLRLDAGARSGRGSAASSCRW